jgi:DNA-binding PadR family transcriptional regulator
MQEVVLALLAKEPSYGYELRARLRQALGRWLEACERHWISRKDQP